MLIHFLEDYKIIGRQGEKIRIRGIFPGLKQEEFVFLNKEEINEDHTYRIEQVEYNDTGGDVFKAVIAAEQFGLV